MAAATAGKPKKPSPGQTSKNSPYTLTPADSLGTPGQASTASGSQRSSADEPRAPCNHAGPQAPPSALTLAKAPRAAPATPWTPAPTWPQAASSPLPWALAPTSMDYGAAATAPPPSLAGRQHPSGMPCTSLQAKFVVLKLCIL